MDIGPPLTSVRAVNTATPGDGLEWGLRAPSRRPRLLGAIDLGTNNCRLLIARPTPEGFRVVDAFSRVVRLGEGLGETGRLSPEAMDRAVAALAVCAEKLRRRGVTEVRSVATEACRRAANGPEFVQRVFKETGLALDVISPAEEARLAVLGCQPLIDDAAPQTLVFDIGGGSTEVVLLERARGPRRLSDAGLGDELRMRGWVSVPWGVVSLAETAGPDPGDRMARLEAFFRMKGQVARHLGALRRVAQRELQLLGASGTVTTLASLLMGQTVYDRRRIDGSWSSTLALKELGHRLAALPREERARLPGIGPDRADLVVAGAAILEALIDLSRTDRIRVADRGLREGILRSLLARPAARAG
ncbi:MAG: Ppx/GppA family phosphatase [Sphingomonadaceae bacterium]|uniref:Ppx/GppA phosphatase family protein n=1 Tax=Thermaurantiacus sp. TaxID=2820283 RepID=UPI00298F1324|nr:Ppx/GppA phosphatase family protein [Thermaurantiacus sp.]MCS6987508.1 Ppx/GppA family phosphatase [Sphingomonadaceae bacterium]MDW8415109.1 Ppx/GppA phosphatase family protein [Thermaurantiacus sp.]